MRRPPKPARRGLAYTAGLEVQRAGVTVHVAEVPAAQLTTVLRHVLASMEAAGLVGVPDDDRPIEAVGGYAPLDIKEDDFEQAKKRPPRVGF